MDPHKVVNELHRNYCKRYNVNKYDVSVGLMAWEPVIFVTVKDLKTGELIEDRLFDYYGKEIERRAGI